MNQRLEQDPVRILATGLLEAGLILAKSIREAEVIMHSGQEDRGTIIFESKALPSVMTSTRNTQILRELTKNIPK